MSGLNVFTFWNGSLKSAPPVVKASIQSWRHGCSVAGYHHHIIHEENLVEWEGLMGEDGGKLKYFREHGLYLPDHKWRKYTDMLRLLLLKHFNGIWVDSTVMLMQPLDDWIPDPAKFGGLQLPKGSGPVMESWLLISLQPCSFLDEWADFFADYSVRINHDAPQWKVRRFSIPWWMQKFNRRIKGWSHHWFSDWFLRIYPRSPYYAIYYSFSLIWDRSALNHGMEKFRTFLPHSLDGWSVFNSTQRPDWRVEDVDPALLESLNALPFLKLDWKRSPSDELHLLPQGSLIKDIWSRSLACQNP